MRQILLLQNATAILLQNATSLLQNTSGFLLQNATVITNCGNLITKCGSYYKMQRLSQIATVHQDMKILNQIILKKTFLDKISNN